MGWKEYFDLGFGGNKPGSTVFRGLDATTDEEFGFGTYRSPQQWYWSTTVTKPKPSYYASRPGKRWK